MQGKMGIKLHENILDRNSDIFFSQDSVSSMLLLLKRHCTVLSNYKTSDDSLQNALPAPCNDAI